LRPNDYDEFERSLIRGRESEGDGQRGEVRSETQADGSSDRGSEGEKGGWGGSRRHRQIIQRQPQYHFEHPGAPMNPRDAWDTRGGVWALRLQSRMTLRLVSTDMRLRVDLCGRSQDAHIG
jgi:hypothetical protein